MIVFGLRLHVVNHEYNMACFTGLIERQRERVEAYINFKYQFDLNPEPLIKRESEHKHF